MSAMLWMPGTLEQPTPWPIPDSIIAIASGPIGVMQCSLPRRT